MDKIEKMSIPLGLQTQSQTTTKENRLENNQKGGGKKKNLKVVNRPVTTMPKNLL